MSGEADAELRGPEAQDVHAQEGGAGMMPMARGPEGPAAEGPPAAAEQPAGAVLVEP